MLLTRLKDQDIGPLASNTFLMYVPAPGERFCDSRFYIVFLFGVRREYRSQVLEAKYIFECLSFTYDL